MGAKALGEACEVRLQKLGGRSDAVAPTTSLSWSSCATACDKQLFVFHGHARPQPRLSSASLLVSLHALMLRHLELGPNVCVLGTLVN